MFEVRSPDRVRDVIAEIKRDDSMNSGIEAMKGRADEIGSKLKAKLIGIAMDPKARHHWDMKLDQWWAENSLPKEVDEIVVGGGLHAAIYCAIRAQMGAPKPLVIERETHVGGAFAYTKDPSFWVNSRNRPGNLGIPGRDEALNVLPGAIVQPCDLGGEEYQSNIALAFSIRSTLAMFARVVTGCNVTRRLIKGVGLADGSEIFAKRVIYATGLGDPAGRLGIQLSPGRLREMLGVSDSPLMDYPTFLRRFDGHFPLKGLDRVAVIGAGDSGKTVIEALIGQGPSTSMSVASMDFPERIDWYGVEKEACSRAGWEKCNRSRYKGIARSLPRDNAIGELRDVARVYPTSRKAEYIELGSTGVFVDGALYDAAIIATGFRGSSLLGGSEVAYYPILEKGSRSLARDLDDASYVIGPAAQFPPDQVPNLKQNVAENTVALFRYADRTAAFAMAMPVENPKLPKAKRRSAAAMDSMDQKRKILEALSL